MSVYKQLWPGMKSEGQNHQVLDNDAMIVANHYSNLSSFNH